MVMEVTPNTSLERTSDRWSFKPDPVARLKATLLKSIQTQQPAERKLPEANHSIIGREIREIILLHVVATHTIPIGCAGTQPAQRER
jgi:hypothetical protein